MHRSLVGQAVDISMLRSGGEILQDDVTESILGRSTHEYDIQTGHCRCQRLAPGLDQHTASATELEGLEGLLPGIATMHAREPRFTITFGGGNSQIRAGVMDAIAPIY